jgi:hypothetical protein
MWAGLQLNQRTRGGRDEGKRRTAAGAEVATRGAPPLRCPSAEIGRAERSARCIQAIGRLARGIWKPGTDAPRSRNPTAEVFHTNVVVDLKIFGPFVEFAIFPVKSARDGGCAR